MFTNRNAILLLKDVKLGNTLLPYIFVMSSLHIMTFYTNQPLPRVEQGTRNLAECDSVFRFFHVWVKYLHSLQKKRLYV